ncbi:MAG: HEAT repeat domain-containing protein, partial [Planktothrix sp.]
QMPSVVSAVRHCLYTVLEANPAYENGFQIIWNIAQDLPYPDFYRAWHGLTETQTSPLIQTLNLAQLPQLLQNLPIFCLNAYILATETDTSEIAQTLCQLIWDEAFPDQDYPQEVTTASKLREHLKKLKLTRNQPKLNLLLTHCEHPTDELIAFCHKLTNILSIAWLTDKSLEAPLKGFPPHQPNLLSAIQTWLDET